MKAVILNLVRILGLPMGIIFPFVGAVWKVVILVVAFILRAIEADHVKHLRGVYSLFLIGMIIAYVYKLFQ